MNTDRTYIYLGNSPDTLNLTVPYPTTGDAPYKEEVRYSEEINANGVAVRHRIGDAIITMSLGWGKISTEKWWEINRFFEKNGDLVYCKFFRHNIGEWQIKRFFKQPTECNPILVKKDTGIPAYYTGARLELVGVGE